MLKHRIILIFSALTTVLVAVMAWVSYVAVREIYLNQVSEQTRLLTRLIGSSQRYNATGSHCMYCLRGLRHIRRNLYRR